MLKIITLNLNYYGNKHGEWADRKKLIAQSIREEKADIVAFQAVCAVPSINNGVNQAAQIAEMLPEYSYCVFSPVSRQDDGKQEGNAVLSKYPMREVEHLLLNLKEGTDDQVQRLIIKTRFDLANEESFYLFNGHFSWVKEQTEENIREALPFVNAVSEKALLVGDMNTDAKDGVLKPLKESGWADAWEKANNNKGDGFTFESDKPFTRIDYAWANKKLQDRIQDVKVIKQEKEGVRLSDHLALAVTITD